MIADSSVDVELDIIIPVYNEGRNIIGVLESLRRSVRTPFRTLICYDRDDDDTLTALRDFPVGDFALEYVKNTGDGAHGAVLTGFDHSTAPAVLVLPADDDYNAPIIDPMVRQFRAGCEIVVASRFVPGGCMTGCPLLKSVLVRTSAFMLHHLALLPTRDPTNGFRLFSRSVVRSIPIESTAGFAYSIELLVKCHRLRWKIGEIAASWHERRKGPSRFRVIRWLPGYLRWFGYAFATTCFRLGPGSVALRGQPLPEVTSSP